MKFNDIVYRRPAIEEIESNFRSVLQDMDDATSLESFHVAFLEIYKMRDDYDTMHQLAQIRYNINVSSKKYQEEMAYFNEISPIFENLINQFYTSICKSKFKDELSAKWGNQILDLAEFSLSGFDPVIMEDLKENNDLTTQYIQLKGRAEFLLGNEKLNLGSIGKYFVDDDRSTRKKAYETKWQFFEEKQAQFDDVFDQMVKVRHRMAKKMNCENFIELGYKWMGRIDYDEDMVDNFRRQIVEEIVPLSQRLRERQRKRLGYEKLQDYDMNFHFSTGNPKPKDPPEIIVANAKTMYRELSPDTEEFYNYLLKYDLMDLISRPGKNDGGFCEHLSNYRHPFIFANFNGTAGDIRVLTHEGGHAFQYYKSRDHDIVEYRLPSSEAAEIHAMSMEMLTYPWMEIFFKEDTEKYYYSHMSNQLLFLPYGCAIDHFQHIIYKHPEYNPDQRAEVWMEMVKLYLPDHKMDSTPHIKSGRSWQSIMHIYQYPFYMIDYVLAQICAFQFWQKANVNRAESWSDYLRLCKAGGTQSFLQLVEMANLKSPFEDGTIKGIAADISNYLDSIDDTQF